MPPSGADIHRVQRRPVGPTRRPRRVPGRPGARLTVAALGIWLAVSLSSAVVLLILRDGAPAAAQTTTPVGSNRAPTTTVLTGSTGSTGSTGTTVATTTATTAAPARRPLELVLDRNAALFEVAGLVPGSTGVNCVTARLVDGDDVDTVRLFGEVGGTGLADYLDVVLEAGTVAPGAACSSFVGSVVFTGSLAELGRRHRDAASALGLAVGEGRATIRMTWTLRDDNAAQGLTATAALVFEARGLGVAVEEPTTTTVPSTTSSATTPSTSVPVRREPAGPSETTESRVEMLARLLTDWLPDAVQPAIRDAIGVAVLTTELAAKTTAFPSAFIVALGIFVMLQHRIDRADPKLVRAPTHPEPDLQFLPRRTIGRAS